MDYHFGSRKCSNIGELIIAVGISSFNTAKIVPLRFFDDVFKKLESQTLHSSGK
jgi:hypothetical protein